MAMKKLDYLRELVQILKASGVRSYRTEALSLEFAEPAPVIQQAAPMSAEIEKIMRESLADPLSDPATHHGGLPTFRRYDSAEDAEA